MQDLISRQAAVELIHTLYPSAPIMRGNRELWEERYKPYIEAEKALEKLPSAQPEIIHCRDCRYSTDFYHDGCCYCKMPSKEMRYIEEGYGFYCAGAERRADQ